SFRCTHLGASDNQKRWLVVGTALNKVLVPQIRPFVEQEVDKEYNNLKTSHNIHSQSTSGRLQRWPPRKFLKYENINGNSRHPKLPGGKYNISLFDCRVLSHIDFAKLYVENFMAKFNAFDDHCDASAAFTLLGGVPVFSAAVEAAAGDVRSVRNDWAHCVFSKWDPVKFQQSFVEMEHLVRVIALPAADEAKLLAELKDWETKGTLLCMNSPVDPALLQLVQQEVKFLQDSVNNLSVEFDQERVRVQQELQNAAIILEEMKRMVERLKTFQEDADQRFGNLETRTGQVEDQVHSLEEDTAQRFGKLETRTGQVEDQVHILEEDTAQRFGNLETRTGQVEDQVHSLEAKFQDLTTRESAESNASLQDPLMTSEVIPEKLVELIRRDYKGAVLCPFPWCEDELQLKLSNIFTRLKIVSRTKERSQLTDNTVNMTDVFKPHRECHSPRVVLIEGNPGMGKTTYCQKLAYDWSVGEIPPDASFPEGKILLLLKCRDMYMKTANIEEAIDDQLLPQDANKKEKQDLFHFIRSNQSRILLVLDGLDELRDDLVKGFLPLIRGKVFANVYLMLTARHEVGLRVRRYCDVLFEIVGYTKDDVESYIKKYFSSHEDQSLADKMLKQLKRDKYLAELTANPLNTALLCLLCEETKGVFPSSRTGIYDDLVSCAVRRYYAKKGMSLDYEDPTERCANKLNQLGKMAYETLIKNQLHFSEDEMKCQSADLLQLCFLSREASVSKIRPRPCYAFTHKTFQEYFAALYLAHEILNGDSVKAHKLLDQLNPFDNWHVWEFLLTSIARKSGSFAYFASFCVPSLRNLCLHSDLNSLLLATIQRAFHPTHSLVRLELANTFSVFLDPVFQLISHFCNFSLHAEALKLILCSSFLLTHLDLSRIWVSYEGIEALGEGLRRNCSLTHLKLRECGICDAKAQTLANGLVTNCTLTHLNLMMNVIGSCGAEALADVLHCNCTLVYLDLRENHFGDSVAEAFARVLQSNCALAHLNFRKCVECMFNTDCIKHSVDNLSNDGQVEMIGPSGASALARALRLNCSLTFLNLELNQIEASGAEALGEALQTNCTLTHLYLMDGVIGDSGAEALSKALQLNCTLTHLDLRCNRIGDLGAVALATTLLSSGTQLSQLNISNNMISSSGVTAFAKVLQSNTSLTRLALGSQHLPDVRIDSSGAILIAVALKSNRTLTHLDLSSSKIGDSGATELAQSLQHHNNSVKYLDLRCNPISLLGKASLDLVDQSNRFL
ncbi:unnamed protein product, partial [Porites evermanni]